MRHLSNLLLVPTILALVLVLLVGCGSRVEFQVEAHQTYIGPKIADSINVKLTGSWRFDYKVNMDCSFTNVGGPGRVNVLATLDQGDESWDRYTSLQAKVDQPMTVEFEFAEPTFGLSRILAPLVSLVVGDWGGVALAFLGGQGESGIRGSCQVLPHPADTKMQLDCIVSNLGESSGTVTVRGGRGGIGQTREVNIGPKEQRIIPFFIQVESEEDRLECRIE